MPLVLLNYDNGNKLSLRAKTLDIGGFYGIKLKT
jgi:hypothetical protein